MERLQRRLGHTFSDSELLARALRHRSAGADNNERLEFMGDAILNCAISEALFQRFPDSSEGDLSRMRASLVCGEELAALGRELDLGEVLELGPGERKSGGRQRDSILADTVEALFGALSLDGGRETARLSILTLFAKRLSAVSPHETSKDAKTRLQEWLQGRGLNLPVYHLAAVEGQDHQQEFVVECQLAHLSDVFSGVGSSRRRAEQAAAAVALEYLNA